MMLRKFVELNQLVSSWIDALVPDSMTIGGNRYYKDVILPSLLMDGLTVYDLGGGSRPHISVEEKNDRDLRVIGLDIELKELESAPEGSYDKSIAENLSHFKGAEDGDLVICQATLEHVRDTTGAIAGISSAMKDGGVAAIFVPCRNALFARINLLLPESLKKRLLFSLYPHKAEGHDGFQAFYDKCTPAELEEIARSNNLEVESVSTHWQSSYFSFFFPGYILWRIWTLIAKNIFGDQFCESFVMVLKKVERQA